MMVRCDWCEKENIDKSKKYCSESCEIMGKKYPSRMYFDSKLCKNCGYACDNNFCCNKCIIDYRLRLGNFHAPTKDELVNSKRIRYPL